MVWLLVVMAIWIVLLTAAMVGLLFRTNEMSQLMTVMGVRLVQLEQLKEIERGPQRS